MKAFQLNCLIHVHFNYLSTHKSSYHSTAWPLLHLRFRYGGHGRCKCGGSNISNITQVDEAVLIADTADRLQKIVDKVDV